MNLDLWFSASSQFAMVGWLLLAVMPQRQKWLFQLTGLIMPALLGIAYAVLIIPNFTSVEGAGYGSLAQVRALFTSDALIVSGWIHYLAFDLAVGTWIAKRSDEIGLSRIIQLPLLFLTLMFGPVGLMLFVFIAGLKRASLPLFKGAVA